jgi:hypothetical protein
MQGCFALKFRQIICFDNEDPTSLRQRNLENHKWQGARDGYHAIAFAFMPIFWENNFKGSQRTIEDGPDFQ